MKTFGSLLMKTFEKTMSQVAIESFCLLLFIQLICSLELFYIRDIDDYIVNYIMNERY